MGIPATVVIRNGFGQIVNNAVASLGFPAQAPLLFLFPDEMLDEGVDVTPYMTESIDKIIAGLTTWKPKVTTKGVVKPEKITVTGKDYEEAVLKMHNGFLMNSWGDGLSTTPPTDKKVNWILTGTDLSRDTVIGAGKIPPAGGIATVEALAITLAMAGGRPEYLPVVIAAVEAFTRPEFVFAGMQATHSAVFLGIVVNGPMAKQIRLASGHGCMGPDPNFPAAGPIGRAIRIIQQAMGGAVPGLGTVGQYGGMRATNAVLAEDEDRYPKGWPTLAMERGFAAKDNAVTVFPAASVYHMTGGLISYGLVLGTPTGNVLSYNNWEEPWKSPDHFCGACLMPPSPANDYKNNNGYSKEDCKRIIWENSFLKWDEAVKAGHTRDPIEVGKLPAGKDLPITPSPKNITLIVAGGSTGGQGSVMTIGGGGGYVKTGAKITLPAKWNDLLAQAEKDLGPIPPPN